jgi:hypothetical protein
MPNGVGGQDLVRLARERRPDLKALYTSGYSERFIEGLRRSPCSPSPTAGKPCSPPSAASSTAVP